MDVTIALDAMGGDHGATEIVPAALKVVKKHRNLHLILVGKESLLLEILTQYGATSNTAISIHHAPETVEMHEPPSKALRNKKASSMRIAIDLVQDNVAQACVSAGNTGALMAISKFVLKTLPGIDRPAICATLPTCTGHTHMLDLGANVSASAEQLLQFAIIGSELVSATENISTPSVALLNVGSEDMKGNDQVKLASTLLANSYLNYVGFAEGTDIHLGEFDLIVCDGFVGNIALKTSEGVAELISRRAKEAFRKSIYGRFAALVSLPVLRNIQYTLDPRRYNGASLLGLRGSIVKSHGSADQLSFSHAIEEAVAEVENNIPGRISSKLEDLLGNGLV